MHEIDCYYGKNKKACIIQGSNDLFVEFFEDGILISLQNCAGHDINWAEKTAQSFCAGILKVKPYWEKEFGTGKSNILKSDLPGRIR
jgi:hypothetical protein